MPASHAYPPYIEGIIFDATGKPAAGGTVEAYVAGSSVPAALWSTSSPATSLGPVVTIDGAGRAAFRLREGYAYKLRAKDKDGALIWERDNVKCPLDGGGVNIPNPMESTGDMIVGGVGGQPERLAPGAEGDALKIVNGVPTWAPDAEGMQNPMTTAGDLIVGTTGGEPARLGVGTDGDILATASGAPTWEGGPKKYRNVYQNIPSPQIDDGYLGCLFYLSGSAQALTLPATANIPSKSFIDFVFLDGTATLTITPQGSTTLNEQSAAVTIGGQAATLYRLTFLGHGGSGDEWALGGSGNGDHKVSADGTDTAGYLEDKIGAGSGISLATSAGKVVVSASTQPGDHKTAVDGADSSPDYLANKLAAGSGISLTNTGSAVEIAATAQSGDHQLLVSATDAAAGYLGAKLTAGTGVTLTPQTDGDGVQSIEISATGGGGGGETSWEPAAPCQSSTPQASTKIYVAQPGGACLPPIIKSFTVCPLINPYSVAGFYVWVAVYDASVTGRPIVCEFTWTADKHPSTSWSYTFATFNFDAPYIVDRTHSYRVVFNYGSSSNSSFAWMSTARLSNLAPMWGNMPSTYSTSPHSSYDYTGWEQVYQLPWFQLNSFSV